MDHDDHTSGAVRNAAEIRKIISQTIYGKVG